MKFPLNDKTENVKKVTEEIMNTHKETFQKLAQEESTEQPKLTRYLVGTYFDPSSGEWLLAKLKFDPKTLVVGEITTERVTGDFEVARERFEVMVSRLGMFDIGESTYQDIY